MLLNNSLIGAFRTLYLKGGAQVWAPGELCSHWERQRELQLYILEETQSWQPICLEHPCRWTGVDGQELHLQEHPYRCKSMLPIPSNVQPIYNISKYSTYSQYYTGTINLQWRLLQKKPKPRWCCSPWDHFLLREVPHKDIIYRTGLLTFCRNVCGYD